MELIIRSRSFLLSVLNCFIQILPSWLVVHVRLLALRRVAGLVAAGAAARARCSWRGFEPRRYGRRGAELGVVPDVVTPVLRSGLHPRTASKRCFVAMRLRCRNGGAQAPINVISTPTCGVLIRILVCARGMSRKEAFARRFVTGLLLAGRRQVQWSCQLAAHRHRRHPTAPVCVTEHVPFRWWYAVHR